MTKGRGPAARVSDWTLRLSVAAAAILLLSGATPDTPEVPFLAANATAMHRMMSGMAVKPTGDVDQDFVSMMEPHHQGAVEMAQAELRYGHNEQLRRIAQEIIVDQQQEIVAMRLATGRPLPAAAPTPDQQSPEPMAARDESKPMQGH
jgi:hypothetical protein